MITKEPTPEGKILSVHIATKNDLYAAYMPFIKTGGLFIITKEQYQIDEEIFLLLKLLDGTEKYTLIGRVIWLTPAGAQGNLPPGVGLQFIGDNAEKMRDKIETLLAGTDDSGRKTSTM